MRLGSRRTFVGAIVIAVVCLMGVAIAGSQSAPAQTAQGKPTLTDDVFKSVVMLRGIPVDNFFESMGMFAAAMGTDCTFCHVSNAYFDKNAFATPTPRINRARADDRDDERRSTSSTSAGQPRVTCFTCHARQPGSAERAGPRATVRCADRRSQRPDLSRRYPLHGRIRSSTSISRPSAARRNLSKLTSFSPRERTRVRHGVRQGPRGDRRQGAGAAFDGRPYVQRRERRTFDGASGWMAGPDTPVPLLTLTGGNLDGAKLEAMLWFPASIRQAFTRVARRPHGNRRPGSSAPAGSERRSGAGQLLLR